MSNLYEAEAPFLQSGEEVTNSDEWLDTDGERKKNWRLKDRSPYHGHNHTPDQE